MVTGPDKKYGNHVASPTGANLSKQAMQTNKLFCGIDSTAVDEQCTTFRIRMENRTHGHSVGHPCGYNFVSWSHVLEAHHFDMMCYITCPHTL